MATYKKLLKNRAGDTIIPVVDVINYLYPVGSIYMSATMSTVEQVQAAFGGTWTKWGAGRVPVGVDTSQTEFDTVEKTGGEKTHKLTTNEMPRHKGHYIGDITNTNQITGAPVVTKADPQSQGGDQPHNNLQPYITCYMYKRTA